MTNSFREMALNKSQLGVVVRCYLNGHYGEQEYKDWLDYWFKYHSNGYVHGLPDKFYGLMFRITQLECGDKSEPNILNGYDEKLPEHLYQHVRELVSDNYDHFSKVFIEELREWMSDTGVPMFDDIKAIKKYENESDKED
jgi:hypothetical protein